MIRFFLFFCWILLALFTVEGHQASAQPADKAAEEKSEAGQALMPSRETKSEDPLTMPLIALAVGIVIVLGLIIGLKVNAFLALITAALAVSLLAPGDIAEKISRVATAFGGTAGGIGIVIALAAVIGKCMLDSGAADRVVRAFLSLLGEKRAPLALLGSGFVLAIPVFFDTVFYLLVPLARSMYRRTNKNYLMYILAIGAGGAITHTLVPPTPGPLVMAENLNFDVGIMIMIGLLVAAPAALAGLLFASIQQRFMPIPMRPLSAEPELKPLPDSALPSLALALAPVILPVILISTNTVLTTLADAEHAALLKPADFKNFEAWRQEVRLQSDEKDTVAARLRTQLQEDSASKEQAALLMRETPLSAAEQESLIGAINQSVLSRKDFHGGATDPAFVGLTPNKVSQGLVGKDRLRMKKVDVERLNRALLESAYPAQIAEHHWQTPKRNWADLSSTFGNANFALLLSAVIAMFTLVRQRKLSLTELSQAVETSLMSGGVIILITAAGGAFGAMLTAANVGEAFKSLFHVQGTSSGGLALLGIAFLIAAVLKVAQGSSTVAMITASGMLAGVAGPDMLGFHPVYLATAIGAGSLMGSWMNDSGFWIFAKMGGLTETEALKSWTIMLLVLGLVSFGVTLLLSQVLPLV